MSLIGTAIALAAGAYMDKKQSDHNAKKQYQYNSALQSQNAAFQREMAQNAHQYEVKDLEAAGLNPIISAQGSSASSIAGSSAPQGTSAGNNAEFMTRAISNLSNLITATSGQDLNKKLGEKAQQEALESAERTKNITPEALTKIRNLNSATMVNQAEKELKDSQTALNKKGLGSKMFGTDPETKDILITLAALAAGSIGLGGLPGSAKKFKKLKNISRESGNTPIDLSRLD